MKSNDRPVLSVSSRRITKDAPAASAKKSSPQKGRRQLEQHEASLLPFIRTKTAINIQLVDGFRLDNVVPIGFDRYSIGIEYDGFRETVFKSAIARIITPAEV